MAVSLTTLVISGCILKYGNFGSFRWDLGSGGNGEQYNPSTSYLLLLYGYGERCESLLTISHCSIDDSG